MKKTIQRPDGVIETVEGTAQEIAEYERKLKGEVQTESPEKKGPGLLTDEVQHFLRLYQPGYVFTSRMDHTPECDMKVAERGWWSVVAPRCTCGLITYPDQNLKITYGTFSSTDIPKVQ